MDPLSGVLSLLKTQSYASGGFGVDGDVAIQFGRHSGIKCYTLLSGHCWIVVEGLCEPVPLTTGDCFLLPHGLPFRLTTNLSAPPVDFRKVLEDRKLLAEPPPDGAPGNGTGCFMVGGHFVLSGSHAQVLLGSLPPIVHIRKESDRAAMRWSLDRMKEELRDPQPGGSLIAQQLAYMMLVQALRLHLAESAGGVGWLFALADRQMSAAIACMHDRPGDAWTLQLLAERVGMSRSIFAEKFKRTVGSTPMEYLTRWRMLLAGERLKSANESISDIAGSLGYESDSAFGKAFKRVMGCSPKQYSRAGAEALPAHRTELAATS